jgi:hypothetical protein
MSAILKTVGLYNKGGTDVAPDNPKGFYEWDKGVKINERILKSMNSSWDDVKPFNAKRYKKNTEKFKKELMEAIKEDFSGKAYFVIKDPRISVLLPLYTEILESLHVEPLLLIMERSEEEIYLSLKDRNNFSRRKSMALCKKYKTIIYQNHSGYKHIVVQFDDIVSKPIDTTATIIHRLDLPFELDNSKTKKILSFIDSELKHHNIQPSPGKKVF